MIFVIHNDSTQSIFVEIIVMEFDLRYDVFSLSPVSNVSHLPQTFTVSCSAPGAKKYINYMYMYNDHASVNLKY